MQGDEAGQTQVDNPNDGEMAKWSHPIGKPHHTLYLFAIFLKKYVYKYFISFNGESTSAECEIEGREGERR